MDKYTVDLDQVLNDFEYSELTDQQHGGPNKQPPSSYVHNNLKNGNVKHSINNVFYSLNEYLNSNISPKCEIRAPEGGFSGGDGPQLNENNVEEPTIELETVQDGDENVEAEIVVTSNVETEIVVTPKVKEEIVVTPKVKEEIVVTPKVKEEIVVTPKVKEEIVVTPKVKEEEQILVNTDTGLEPEPEQQPQTVVEESDTTESFTEKTEAISEEAPTPIETKVVEIIEKPEEGVITVGFTDDVDIDDSELTTYLADLELEYGAQQNEATSLPQETHDTEIVPTVRPSNLPLSEDDTKTVIDLVGEPGSTPYNNVYVNKELPQEDTECSISASPTFSDISTETNSSCTPSTDTVNNDVGAEEAKVEEAPVEVQNEAPGAAEPGAQAAAGTSESFWLGKQAPLWIPDAEATSCLHCETKFTVIKRRHHCRACGYVLCSKCCNLKYRLEYLDDMARVCNKCHEVLSAGGGGSGGSDSNFTRTSQPNPNNPLEYCSTVPPHQQVSGTSAGPPAVMVPVGVLKRKGSNKARTNKSVMFCDGIRPGSDLTNLDNDFSYKGGKKEEGTKVAPERNFPGLDPDTGSFIPKGEDLPPTVTVNKMEVTYLECSNGSNVVEMLRNETLIFALQTNLLVHVKIVNMDCCINKVAWCFSTEGLINVGQDELVILLELLDNENTVPKDIFYHLNNIYQEAVKGTAIKEMGLSLHNTTNFLGSKNHAGFVYIKPTFQCLQNVIKPQEPYLIGVLIHRWETPWAKLFPLRLILRLGAEYRYYPSPIISNRYRDSVFVEIGHTIINLLADFRNFSYTLPQIRGLTIHMEDKNTTVTIPLNRYDQVMKSMNNSSDHILAFAGNFSEQADSHLVCIQDTQSNENAYSTHAINIHNKPRKVTGASFIVFNGALKSSSGLTAKSSIVEDGLMIQIPAEHMAQIRDSLRNMKDHTVQCGCINAASDETVNIVWGKSDVGFNANVFSPIDNKPMEGIPSIRVHNGKDYVNGGRLIRWTEVFIVQNEGEASRNQDPVDISKLSETLAKATCTALIKYLDLLVSNSFYKIGIRANLDPYFVAYSAGSNGTKLPPIYMESLDNELIPVLHRNATNDCDESTIILELIFRILNK